MAEGERDNEYEVRILGELQPAFDRWFAQLNPATQAGAIFMPTAFKAGYAVAGDELAQLRKQRDVMKEALGKSRRWVAQYVEHDRHRAAAKAMLEVIDSALSNSDTEGEG